VGRRKKVGRGGVWGGGGGLITAGAWSCQFCCLFLFLAQQPSVGQGLLIHEVSRSYTRTQSVRLLWTSDQLVAETST